MADLIDRQAALDAIMGQPPEPHYPSWYAAQIEKLPAVQPEQRWIPCGKCLHADGKRRRCKVLDRAINEDYFCYWAEPYREEGETE